MREFDDTIEWYRTHTTAREIGFNPDGMCLKICRTARAIGSHFSSAKQAQDATPESYRAYKVRDLRKGMVVFYDDPNDSNRFGHIVTMIGRVPGFDPDKLSDCLMETNSVQKGKLTVVRGDYFPTHWGDSFQFGARWLNGMVLDVPQDKESRVFRFKRSGPNFNVKLLDRAIAAGRVDLKPKLYAIESAVVKLPTDKRNSRVTEFQDAWHKRRVLKMPLLNEAVVKGRSGTVKDVRDELRSIIKSLPDA